jgi:ArsR family metal-binding transcriptional regulator
MILAGIALVVGLLLFVLLKLSDIIGIQEAIMAAIDDAVTAESAKIDTLIAKVNETIVTLGELKVLVQQGQNTGNAEAALAAIGAKVDEATANLATAETDADPTPDV